MKALPVVLGGHVPKCNFYLLTSSSPSSTGFQAFSDAGCRHLILVDRDGPGLESTVKEMAIDPSRVTTHSMDIRDDDAVEKLVYEIPEKYGSLDYAL
jgi:NADP-dependent 3-hydroxy acid dehydrogenase YdfG